MRSPGKPSNGVALFITKMRRAMPSIVQGKWRGLRTMHRVYRHLFGIYFSLLFKIFQVKTNYFFLLKIFHYFLQMLFPLFQVLVIFTKIWIFNKYFNFRAPNSENRRRNTASRSVPCPQMSMFKSTALRGRRRELWSVRERLLPYRWGFRYLFLKITVWF